MTSFDSMIGIRGSSSAYKKFLGLFWPTRKSYEIT